MRRVLLARLFRMVLGMQMVAVRGMRMVGRLGMVAGVMVGGGVFVMLGSLLVMLGGLGVVVGCILGGRHAGLLIWGVSARPLHRPGA
jgi:hypothetical protein